MREIGPQQWFRQVSTQIVSKDLLGILPPAGLCGSQTRNRLWIDLGVFLRFKITSGSLRFFAVAKWARVEFSARNDMQGAIGGQRGDFTATVAVPGKLS